YLPVTQGVAGSSPVRSATLLISPESLTQGFFICQKSPPAKTLNTWFWKKAAAIRVFNCHFD
ncbi:hypothetical protein, partial [Serratia rubidaea]|uniref:hypothetical protein n=1 Tax=Serratia rubidaea TaxID=61652 RepID=UPI003FA3CF92